MEAPSLTKDIFFKFSNWRLGHIWAHIEFVLALAVTQRPPRLMVFVRLRVSVRGILIPIRFSQDLPLMDLE